MSSGAVRVAAPVAFDPSIYRYLHPDLRTMTDRELSRHYFRHGMEEGRRSHALADRSAFADLARDTEVLEIGPFDQPLLRGANVQYFDVLDRQGLLDRAKRLGTRGGEPPEHIHFVSETGDLSIVDRTFDVVLSSHVVEHQPDLVAHLQSVARCLRPGGAYLLLVPDHRYCFDHFLPPSTIADVLDAHYSKRTIHSLRSQIEHAALTTHNNTERHWAGEHGTPPRVAERAREALLRYRAEPHVYIDVHSWSFTPASFDDLLRTLRELGQLDLATLELYPTLKDNNEFWAVLQKPAD